MDLPSCTSGIGRDDVVERDDDHEGEQHDDADEVEGGLALGRDAPTAEPLEDDEEQSTAVERWDRQHVGDRQAGAEHAGQEEERVPEAGVVAVLDRLGGQLRHAGQADRARVARA